MVPTFLTTLAVGTITQVVAAIIALSTWIPGSQILQGNLFFDTTNNTTPKVFVDTNQTLTLTAGGLGFTTNGTQSGVVIKDSTTTTIASYTVDCTATGGSLANVARYDTCYMPPLLTTTGAIKAIYLMTSAVPKAVGFDCSFVKGRKQGTGTVIQNTNNWAASTGAILTFSTGSLRWNSADSIACKTLNTPTSSFAGKLKVEYFDDTSE